MKKILSIFLVLFSIVALATHNRAGEITYKQINALEYEIQLVTYTYTPSAANETRDYLPINWGDNNIENIPREFEYILPENYTKNVYIARHTYPGPGIYEIVMEDPNRNEGVNNIPGSVNVVFSISTTLKIDGLIGFNSTPVLLNPPLDKALVGQTFIHNPSAFDIEGDSISYKLTTCRQENGSEIPGYTFPESSNSFYVDALNGDLVWDAPVSIGTYNVAMKIEEWRNHIKIGEIIRDIQIEVEQGNGIKPEISPLIDYCVGAGESINFFVEAQDPDLDRIRFKYSGGPFEIIPKAQFEPIADELGYLKYEFSWDTECSMVRRLPYQAVFKVEETLGNPSLIDFKSTGIRIVAPAPEDLVLEPFFNAIQLSWVPTICSEAIAYDIYRKISPSGWEPSSCETGVPDGIGFDKIRRVEGYLNNEFLDNNDQLGLQQGYEYCYRVVAVFEDGAESYASEEQCTELELGYPLITKVSVDSTHEDHGRIEINWEKFTNFNPELTPGPYVYLIYRATDLVASDKILIDSTLSINETTYIDDSLNTVDNIYSYSIEMYSNAPGDRQPLGTPQIASSPFLSIAPDDNKLHLKITKNTPWITDSILIYRQDYTASGFQLIGKSLTDSYLDLDLNNTEEYCYYVQTFGHYSEEILSDTLLNFSQKVFATPIDTIKPCAPSLTAESFCDDYYNKIEWSVPDECLEDIYKYELYYSSTINGEKKLIHTSLRDEEEEYLHYPPLSIAGCYSIKAIDHYRNESESTAKVCVDNCTYYKLPNVFTPNNDSQNDIYKPGPYKFVEKVDMKIYNRWGNLVFQTEDPDINWDGKYMENNKDLSVGVYYYVCDVYEYRLSGVEVRVLTGFIHIFDTKTINNE